MSAKHVNLLKDHPQQFDTNMNALFYEATDEKQILLDYLEKTLGTQSFDQGIDIGAGPGLLAGPLYSRCKQLTLLELLPIYEVTLKEKYPKAKIDISSILDYPLNTMYDLILLSHILYYIPESQWVDTTKKIFNQLSNHGLFIIVLIDTRWVFDMFYPYIGSDLTVWSMDNQRFISQLDFAQVSCEQYQTHTVLKDDKAIANYLAPFFHLSDASIIENNQAAMDQFKRALTFDGNKYILSFTGNILTLRK